MALQSKDFSVQARSGGGGILYTYIVRVIENSVNQDKNTSNVTLRCILKQDYSGASFIDWTMLVTAVLGGKTYISDSRMRTSSGTAEQVYAEWTGDIEHNADGTLSLTVGGAISHNFNVEYLPVSPMALSGKDTFTFTSIPRASKIDEAGNINLGSNCLVRWTPASSGFRYKLRFQLGSYSAATGLIHPNRTTQYTYNGYTIPLNVANQFDQSESSMTVTLYTYSDSAGTKEVGSDSENFTVLVPDNNSTKPVVTFSVAPDNGSLSSTFNGLYIQGKSKIKGTISATEQYGAPVTQYGMTVDKKDYSGQAPVSDYVNLIGSVDVTGWAINTRGYKGTATKRVEFLGYSAPQVQASCGRCNASGSYADDGTYLRIVATRAYNPLVSGGVQYNHCFVRYRYKKEADANYGSWTIILSKNAVNNSVDTGAISGVTLDVGSTYLVQVQAADDLGETSATTTFRISSEAVYMHKRSGGKGLGLGKRVEEDDLLDVAWRSIFRKQMTVEGDIYEGGKKLSDKYMAAGTTVTEVEKAKKLSTPRTMTIGNKGNLFDGSDNVTWTLDDIGAAAKNHSHFAWTRKDVTFTNGVGTAQCDGVKTTSMILAMRNTPASGSGQYTGIMSAGCATNGTVALGLDDNSNTTIPVTILWST